MRVKGPIMGVLLVHFPSIQVGYWHEAPSDLDQSFFSLFIVAPRMCFK